MKITQRIVTSYRAINGCMSSSTCRNTNIWSQSNRLLKNTALLMGALLFNQVQAATQHVVEAGDTLTSIADHYQVSKTALIDTNGLKVTSIAAGQILKIPSKESIHNLHKVELADSLTSLSKKYNVDLAELARINKLTPQSGLLIGSTIIIPNNKPIAVMPVKADEATDVSTIKEAALAPSLNGLKGSSHNGETVPISAATLTSTAASATSTPASPAPSIVRVSATSTPPPKTGVASADSIKTDSKKAGSNADGNNANRNVDKNPNTNKKVNTHIVKYGETLTTIAELYQLDVNQLVQANNMKVTDTLYFGRSLMLPANNNAEKNVPSKTVTPIKYTVKAGDTLIGIATKYKTDFMTIANLSNIKHYLPLHVGQVLMVPNTAK